MKAKDLTNEQLVWFTEHFEHTKNQKLADSLGTSPRCVTRIARELGLCKTKEFVQAMQRNASEHGAKKIHLMGGNAGAKNLLIYGKATRFKAGESSKQRMSTESFEEMHRKIGDSRKKTFQKERRRVLFGLDQKTGLRVIRCPKAKIELRHRLRTRGYEIERASNEVVITDNTKRSPIIEEHAQVMGFKFHFNISNHERENQESF